MDDFDRIAAAEVAALQFQLSGEESLAKGQEPPFWDEHSLDHQRFYDITCLIYGKDPQAGQAYVDNGQLPKSRAERCEGEYWKISNAWRFLLWPYLKNPDKWAPPAPAE